MVNDSILIKCIQNGQIEHLNTLIERYYPEIMRYCLWHTQNRQEAEDATQTTFLRVCTHLKRYTHKGQFRAWVYSIARNACIDLKRQKPYSILDESAPYDEKGFSETEAQLSFEAVIHHLSAEQQELLLLRFSQELKLREVAEILSLPLRTVQSRLHAALKVLKKDLREGEFHHAK